MRRLDDDRCVRFFVCRTCRELVEAAEGDETSHECADRE